MLRIENVSKKYGSNVVLDNINLEFNNGKIYGLIGANGSGKSMILKVLAGYVIPDTGKVYQDDESIIGCKKFIKNAGIIINNPKFLDDKTLIENLKFILEYCKNKDRINLERWIEFYKLEEFKNKKYKELSMGTKQKMLLIQAFMDKPAILLLDECTNALDRESVSKTIKYIKKQKERGKLIIMTSHIDGKLAEICDEIIEISEGRIVNQFESEL